MKTTSTLNDMDAVAPKKGYTLVEVLIAMSLMLGILAISMGFLMESTMINFKSTAKNNINRDLRSVMTRMAIEAKQANFFLIYASAAGSDRNEATDRIPPNGSGDALLLVRKGRYSDMEDMGMDPLRDPRPILGLILYYRDSNTQIDGIEVGPVMRWEVDYSGSPITNRDTIRDVESLIPPFATLRSQSRQVVGFSEGQDRKSVV